MPKRRRKRGRGRRQERTQLCRLSKGESWVGGQKFLFYQMHWHTPSENTIDGRSFPLEAHFVHQLDDPMLVGTPPWLAPPSSRRE